MCIGNGDGDGGGNGLADGLNQLCGNAILYDVDLGPVCDVDGHRGLYERLIFINPCGIKYKHVDGCDHPIIEYAGHVYGDVHGAGIGRLCIGNGYGDGGGNGLADGLNQLCGNAILYDVDLGPVCDVDGHRGLYERLIFINPCGIKYKHVDGCDHPIIEYAGHVYGDVHGAGIGRLCIGNGYGDGGGNGLADGLDQLCGYAVLYDVDLGPVGDVDGHRGIHRRIVCIIAFRIKYQYINGCDHAVI